MTGDLLDALLWHSPLAALSAAAVAKAAPLLLPPAAPPSHHSTTTASYLPRRSATRLHCRADLLCCAYHCRYCRTAPPRRSVTALRCGRAQLLLSYSPSNRFATAAPPRCCRAASLLPRRFATATPQRVLLSDALEPIAVGLGAFQNMLGIMYRGCMFVATSLLSVYCLLLHRPLRQYGAVRLDSDIMGELKESRAYRHHDSHDLCVTVTIVVSIVIHTLFVPNEDPLRKATQARFLSPLSNCLVCRCNNY